MRLTVAYKVTWRKLKHSRVCVTAVQLQDWTGPEGFKRLRLPDFKTIGT